MKIIVLLAIASSLFAQVPPQPYSLPVTVVAQKWFGTAAPGVGNIPGGNLPGDLFYNTAANPVAVYICGAPQGTPAPACTTLSATGWSLVNPVSTPPSGAAGGDLGGTYPNPSVGGLKGVPFCTGFTPTTLQSLVYTTASSPNPCYTASNFVPYTGATSTLNLGSQNFTTTGTFSAFIPVLISTSGPVADPGGSSAFQFNNAAGALTFNAPAGVAGLQRCYRNATGKSGAITIQMATSNTVDLNGANGSSAGTLVSTGALGDSVCIASDAANHWYAYVGSGSWSTT